METKTQQRNDECRRLTNKIFLLIQDSMQLGLDIEDIRVVRQKIAEGCFSTPHLKNAIELANRQQQREVQ